MSAARGEEAVHAQLERIPRARHYGLGADGQPVPITRGDVFVLDTA